MYMCNVYNVQYITYVYSCSLLFLPSLPSLPLPPSSPLPLPFSSQ